MDKNVKYIAIGIVGVIGIQGAFIAYQDHVISRQEKRAKKMTNLANYLVDVVNRNDTPITEFDKIAIRNIIG